MIANCPIRLNVRFFAAVISLFIGVLLIAVYSPFFPDYSSYGMYIARGTGSLRFYNDPLSALILYIIDILRSGYVEYMLINWLFFYAAIVYLCSFVKSEARAVLAYAYFLFSPVSLLLYQTPRFLLSAAFFIVCVVLVLNTAMRYKIAAVYCASWLSHGFMAMISLPYIALFVLLRNKYRLFVFGFAALMLVFTILIFDIRELNQYLEYTEEARGFGRYLITASAVIFSLFMYGKNSRFVEVSILGFLLFSVLYHLTPFSHRISVYVCFSSLIPFFLLSNSRNFFLCSFVIANIALSIFIVFNGLYGYS